MSSLLSAYRSTLNTLPYPLDTIVEKIGIRMYQAIFKDRHERLRPYVITPQRGHTFTLFLDWQDYTHASYIFYKSWEPGNTAHIIQTLKPGAVFVDVGANVGYFSMLAHSCRAGTILAVEPQSGNVRALKLSADANSAPAQVIAAAAGSESGEVEITSRALNSGSGTMVGDLGAGDTVVEEYLLKESVSMRRLDSIFTEQGIEYVDYLKIDIQGAEYEALIGLGAYLEERRIGVILAEQSDDARVRTLLEASGYFPHKLLKSGTSVRVDLDEPLRRKSDYAYLPQ